MSEPLNVRCARALGCTPLVYNSGRAECLCADYRHAVDPGLVLKPYGESSPEGWACTGPLIERFELALEVVRNGHGDAQYRAIKTDRHRGQWMLEPCAAIAEWATEFGAEVKP